jgi:hypothetical protein
MIPLILVKNNNEDTYTKCAVIAHVVNHMPLLWTLTLVYNVFRLKMLDNCLDLE